MQGMEYRRSVTTDLLDRLFPIERDPSAAFARQPVPALQPLAHFASSFQELASAGVARAASRDLLSHSRESAAQRTRSREHLSSLNAVGSSTSVHDRTLVRGPSGLGTLSTRTTGTTMGRASTVGTNASALDTLFEERFSLMSRARGSTAGGARPCGNAGPHDLPSIAGPLGPLPMILQCAVNLHGELFSHTTPAAATSSATAGQPPQPPSVKHPYQRKESLSVRPTRFRLSAAQQECTEGPAGSTKRATGHTVQQEVCALGRSGSILQWQHPASPYRSKLPVCPVDPAAGAGGSSSSSLTVDMARASSSPAAPVASGGSTGTSVLIATAPSRFIVSPVQQHVTLASQLRSDSGNGRSLAAKFMAQPQAGGGGGGGVAEQRQAQQEQQVNSQAQHGGSQLLHCPQPACQEEQPRPDGQDQMQQQYQQQAQAQQQEGDGGQQQAQQPGEVDRDQEQRQQQQAQAHQPLPQPAPLLLPDLRFAGGPLSPAETGPGTFEAALLRLQPGAASAVRRCVTGCVC